MKIAILLPEGTPPSKQVSLHIKSLQAIVIAISGRTDSPLIDGEIRDVVEVAIQVAKLSTREPDNQQPWLNNYLARTP